MTPLLLFVFLGTKSRPWRLLDSPSCHVAQGDLDLVMEPDLSANSQPYLSLRVLGLSVNQPPCQATLPSILVS